jgi:serine/threonine protein kinase
MMELGNTMSTSSSNGNQMNEVSRAMLENLEVGVMMRLRHPRIVTFLGAGEIIDPPMEGDDVPRVGIFVMLEYAAGGDLTHRLAAAGNSRRKFPWKDRVKCAMDIAEGMAFIHSEGFIHRDLKSLNGKRNTKHESFCFICFICFISQPSAVFSYLSLPCVSQYCAMKTVGA